MRWLAMAKTAAKSTARLDPRAGMDAEVFGSWPAFRVTTKTMARAFIEKHPLEFNDG
jgi:hypothetical protein